MAESPAVPTQSTSPAPGLDDNAALIVVDVQTAFDDPWWGARNNPRADDNILALADRFAATGRPLVIVRHNSANPESPLHPAQPGNELKPYLTHRPDLVVTKQVNSSFHGTPDLDGWLRAQDVRQVVIAGITTNHCCETTARVGGNLGYDVRFALDATHTFDRTGPDGHVYTADELAGVTAANLHEEFATVMSTSDLLNALSAGAQ